MQKFKKILKFVLIITFFGALTYPWWSLALFKKQFLEQGKISHLTHKAIVKTLREPEINIPLKEKKIGDFTFSIPARFELSDTKDGGLTLIFTGEDEEMIYIYKGVRDKEGWIDSCPQLKDIHTQSIDDLKVLTFNILRSYEIARALMIKKVSDIATRNFDIYKLGDEVLTIHHPDDKMSIIETQKGCDLLTINLIKIAPDLRKNILSPIIASSIKFK